MAEIVVGRPGGTRPVGEITAAGSFPATQPAHPAPAHRPAIVPFVDVRAQVAELREELEEAVRQTLDGAAFVQGPAVEAFETAYAAFSGVRSVIGVANGTEAIELTLRCLGIGRGDEVIVPAMTFIATGSAVVRAGATPVFADVLPESLLLDPAAALAAATSRTRAVIGVHLYGQMAPIEGLADRSLVLLEDAAQAQGALRNGKAPGAYGLVATTSFYPGKNLGAIGDAGAILTRDSVVAERCRLLRNHGSAVKYEHPLLGVNSRLDTIQAAALLVKLRHLPAWNDARRVAAARYDALLAGVPGVTPLQTLPGNVHVHHLYVVRVPERERVAAELRREGIEVAVHYPRPMHLHGAFAWLGHGPGDFPIAERAAEQILSLPMFPSITAEQQERVVEALDRALRR